VKVGNSNTFPFMSICWGSLAWGAILASGAGEDAPDLVVGAIFLSPIKQTFKIQKSWKGERDGRKLNGKRFKGDVGFLPYIFLRPVQPAQTPNLGAALAVHRNFLNPLGTRAASCLATMESELLAGLVKCNETSASLSSSRIETGAHPAYVLSCAISSKHWFCTCLSEL
jgi:hypothetical protein